MLENLKSQIANRWAADRGPTSCHQGRLAGVVPGVLRSRAQRHPAARQPLLDEASPRRRTRDASGLGARGEAPQAGTRVRPRRRPAARGCLPLAPCATSSPVRRLSPGEQRIARMLYHSFWYDGGGFDSIGKASTRCARGGRPRGGGDRRRPELRGRSTRASPSHRKLWPTSRSRSTLATSGKRSCRRSTSLGCPTASARASSTSPSATSTPSSSP